VIDGEVVVLDRDGISDFDALHPRRHDKRTQFYAFDMLAGDTEDLRPLPLSLRKASLVQLLSHEVNGILVAEYEQGDVGDVLFRVAWATRALSRRTSIAPMVPAGANTGSK